MVANSASLRCWVTPVRPPAFDVTDARELTELFAACDIARDEMEEVDGVEVCKGVGGTEGGADAE